MADAVDSLSVFLVWHTYSEGGEDDLDRNASAARSLSSRHIADARVAAALQEPGFQDWPYGFMVNKYSIDDDEHVRAFPARDGDPRSDDYCNMGVKRL